MPEGDTIWRTAVALRKRLAGKTVREARPDVIRRLQGRKLLAVEPTGKHLVMRFEGGLALHSHMRMTGQWHLYRPGERWHQPAHRARAVLSFDDAIAVAFAAPVIELVGDPRSRISHLGPDILADDFDITEVLSRVHFSEARTVGELLLDQRICAGIGNIYKCESLWALKIDPWAAPAHLDETAMRRLYEAAREMMRRSIRHHGPPLKHAVHGRAGRPCPRCSTPIRIRAQGEQARLTYWCPRCQISAQRSPAVDVGSSGAAARASGRHPASESAR